MSMCYLCDMCRKCTPDIVGDKWCTELNHYLVLDMLVIDWGKQDPHEICKHFEPKEGAMTSAKDYADFSGAVTGRVLASNLDKLPEPDTFCIFMTRGEPCVRELVSKAFGNIRRVVIDVDGEKHEYDADTLIALLDEIREQRRRCENERD